MTSLPRPNTMRLLMLALLCLSLGGHRPARAADTTTAQAPGPAIDGFRSAKFGMSESQVRSAITSDFNIPASAITEAENALQRTMVLNLMVPNLVPDGGAAAVSYVLGFTSHKLIEVNILWSPEIDPKTTPQMLYQNGQSLQQYFAAEGFPASRSTGNIATPNGVLLFRGTDTSGNAVLLILSGTLKADQKSGKSLLTPNALTLAYAADPMHPDVFQLSKGSF